MFSGGSLIPNLYYSYLSAAVSNMCGFGVVSFRHYSKPFDYFLIRTEGGWGVFPRQSYIKDMFGKDVQGWHEQSIGTYQNLQKLGYELPEIDLDHFIELKRSRNKFHYSILGKTSMEDFYGIDEFFNGLPQTLKLIIGGYNLLIYLDKDSKKIYPRLQSIIKNLPSLYDLYGKDKSMLPQ